MALDANDPLSLTIPVTVTINLTIDLDTEFGSMALLMESDILNRFVNEVVRSGLQEAGLPAMNAKPPGHEDTPHWAMVTLDTSGVDE